MNKEPLCIWFIIGLQLIAIGLIVLTASISDIYFPVPNPVVLANLHAGLYEGSVLLALGGIYVWRFWPSKSVGGQRSGRHTS